MTRGLFDGMKKIICIIMASAVLCCGCASLKADIERPAPVRDNNRRTGGADLSGPPFTPAPGIEYPEEYLNEKKGGHKRDY